MKTPIEFESVEIIDGKLYVCKWRKADALAERVCVAMVLHKCERE